MCGDIFATSATSTVTPADVVFHRQLCGRKRFSPGLTADVTSFTSNAGFPDRSSTDSPLRSFCTDVEASGVGLVAEAVVAATAVSEVLGRFPLFVVDCRDRVVG